MTPTQQKEAGPLPEAMGKVRDELMRMLAAQAKAAVRATGDKIKDSGLRAAESATGSKVVPDVAGRVLKGENPAAATAGSLKEGITRHVPGMGPDEDSEPAAGEGDDHAFLTKVTAIIEAIDVGVPRSVCYNHWTEFEDFGTWAKGVTNVTQQEDEKSTWGFKMVFSSREYESTIEEQVPDDRVIWSSEGAKGTTYGAVTFHELGPSLTRVIAVVEYSPSGFFEKLGNLWRAQGRRLRLDMKNFQRYVTLSADPEIEGWRGEIRDGEVVRTHEEAMEAAESEEDEDESEEDGPESADESDGDEEEEYEEDDEEEPEEDER
ncbi:SRPBCC family protein [Streptomyces lonarensis]|uniref:SRPBCC family protein n=1 Tax=Streptomyces lonarensis TaxID=700599 RepID=A0A7X6HZ21_9ACTN|nr:SRPBCC family protein [Streptomyces lonarensis]NJQ06208.1 SRPBCC family protein [Streptomyces lonarensis]